MRQWIASFPGKKVTNFTTSLITKQNYQIVTFSYNDLHYVIGLKTLRGVSKKCVMKSCNELDFVIFGRLIKVNIK